MYGIPLSRASPLGKVATKEGVENFDNNEQGRKRKKRSRNRFFKNEEYISFEEH